jgi:uncharacterized repeat protein (TIGR03803 family)
MRGNLARFRGFADLFALGKRRIAGIHRNALIAVSVLLATIAGSHAARTQTLNVLYSFCSTMNSQGYCTDGADPVASLYSPGGGDFYGTTHTGGTNNAGTVFEVSGTSETVLYNFCSAASCTDGELPAAGLIADSGGNLYGTTQYGGADGSGTVFELKQQGGSWTEEVLYSFCGRFGCLDGTDPAAELLMDSTGSALYGIASGGGMDSAGVAFELKRKKAGGHWYYHKLYYFCSRSACDDGASPQAGLVMDSSGNLFGTTEIGGKHNSGTAFELTYDAATTKWKEAVLHNFCSVSEQSNPCKDGASPAAKLTFGAAGNLYGTTYQGGYGNPGYGVAFELVSSSGAWIYSVLHRFCKTSGNCTDGLNPLAGLVFNGTNFVGTTPSSTGGSGADGTVFSLTPSGSETPLFTFCGAQCTDGKNNGDEPVAGVVVDGSGNIYGTTALGGANGGGGEVFQLMPTRQEVLSSPTNSGD